MHLPSSGRQGKKSLANYAGRFTPGERNRRGWGVGYDGGGGEGSGAGNEVRIRSMFLVWQKKEKTLWDRGVVKFNPRSYASKRTTEPSYEVGHNVAGSHAHARLHVCRTNALFVALLRRQVSRSDKSCSVTVIDQL